MKIAVYIIVIAGVIFSHFTCPALYPDENFIINIKGSSEKTGVDIRSSGGKINLDAALDFIHDEGQINAEITSVKDKPLFRRPGMRAGGNLTARLKTSMGNNGPGLSGSVAGEEMFLEFPAEGIAFKNGSLRVAANNKVINIESLEFNKNGRAFLSGKINFEGEKPAAEIIFGMKAFPLIRRADRNIKLTGAGSFRSREGKGHAEGDFYVDKADIYIRDTVTSYPPAKDIIVIGEEPPSPSAAYPFETALLNINLGGNFRIRTNEIDAMLEGELKLKMSGGKLSATGSVRALEGSYKAYGQEMRMERAVITFTGPPDNPGLDILALHEHRHIDVGVRISGTLGAPNIELYSHPDMPDVEKLSILVLGRSLETAGEGDMSLIAAAAAAILAPEEYAKLESELLKMTGLDEIRLAAEEDGEETVVILGKRISSRLYFKYKIGLAGLTNAAILEYMLTQKWLIRAETGYDNLVGLTYSIAFD